jgi:O-methyltransferase
MNEPDNKKEHINFNIIWNMIKNVTIAHPDRCNILYQLCKSTLHLDGDIAEVGVYKGGTLKLLAKAGYPKITHGFETFTGLPKPDSDKDDNRQIEGRFCASYKEVQQFLSDCPNIKLYPGIFPQTASDIIKHNFSFVHVDCDIFQSVFDCCHFFYPRLTQGGIMVFDDYSDPLCCGAREAVNTFFKDILTTKFKLNFPTSGQYIVFKNNVEISYTQPICCH